MKTYKVTYKLFNYISYVTNEISHANIRAHNEDHAVDKLKKALKINGHRLNKIINVELINDSHNIMDDIQNGVKL